MDEKIKKIIAKEGLIILSIFFFIIILGETITRYYLEHRYYFLLSKPQNLLDELKWYKENVILPLQHTRKIVFLPAFFGFYIFSWGIRFIIWSIKTLKLRDSPRSDIIK